MKKVMALLLAAGAAGSALAQPSVGISIGINQPGVYGRINIGDLPGSALVLPQPVIIAPPAVVLQRRPIYLYVPPAHQRDWRHYCGRYGACGQPVYFVQENWVRERYGQEHPGWDRGRGHDDHGRGHDRDGGRDRGGHDHDHDRRD
jgi:hypothetical protein